MKEFRKNYLIFVSLALVFVATIGLFSLYKYRQSHDGGIATQQSHHILKDISQLRTLVFQTVADYRDYMTEAGEDHYKDYQSDKARSASILDGILLNQSLSFSQQEILYRIQKNLHRLTQDLEAKGGGSGPDIDALQDKLMADTNLFITNEDIGFNQRIENLIMLNANFYKTIMIGCLLSFLFLIFMNYHLLLSQNRHDSIQQKFALLKERQSQSFQATRDGIFEWRFQDHEIYWSPRLKEIIGYKDDELRSSSEVLEELMHPDDRSGFWGELHKHLRRETPEFSSFFRLRHKEGHWVWINARGRATYDSNNEPVELIGVHSDVTELKEFQSQLELTKTEAEKANSVRSDFLSHMSHEIRTPLTAITGVAEILAAQSAKFDEKTQRLLAALNSSALTLRDLVSDILDYSRIESGRIVLEKKPIDICELFAGIVSVFARKAEQKNIVLTADYSQLAGSEIAGDRARIHQVIVNILSNALKFTEHGAIAFEAKPLMLGEEIFIEINIRDTGIGMSKEEIDVIFSGFRQADSSISRKYGGAGLGLSIAVNLAKLMGGEIAVLSTPCKGSTFTIRFPANIMTSLIPVAEAEEVKLRLESSDKILVVEDYEGNIAFITHMLNEMGIDHDLGRNGLEGVRLWHTNHYRLVLMDIQMPEMDGISALRHIRETEKEGALLRTPVIAMTAHAFQEDRKKCLDAGFDDYLAKPLTKQGLSQSMARLLNS